MSVSMLPEDRKALGAYYTSTPTARFLAQWAIRNRTDTVLEPSFGDGSFIAAAASRIQELGGRAEGQISAYEVDPRTHECFCLSSAGALGLDPDRIVLGDFFDVPAQPRFSVIIGNPPFIRYQSFTGEARQKGLGRAAEAGVNLSELSSSWAPFVIHAARFLLPGGRLAMVMPLELLQAAYARPVLRFFGDSFASVQVLTFDRKLFPALSQDTVLVLASGYGRKPHGLDLKRLAGPEHLTDAPATLLASVPSQAVETDRIEAGDVRVAEYRISAAARDLYRRLAADARVRRLGDFADVGIGYVTGANDFFHLSTAEAKRLRIRKCDVRPAIRRGRDLNAAGLWFTREDWDALNEAGGKYHLFYPIGDLNRTAARYVMKGQRIGVSEAYKCRVRKPWWRVPWVVMPDLVLSVMSGSGPRLVANAAGVVATNSLHTVRLREPLAAADVAGSAVNTLTLLSAEIEGHALGGGLLKLEPTEAGRLLIPAPRTLAQEVGDQLDRYLRTGLTRDAVALGDEMVLKQHLGLSAHEIALLQTALTELKNWRQAR